MTYDEFLTTRCTLSPTNTTPTFDEYWQSRGIDPQVFTTAIHSDAIHYLCRDGSFQYTKDQPFTVGKKERPAFFRANFLTPETARQKHAKKFEYLLKRHAIQDKYPWFIDIHTDYSHGHTLYIVEGLPDWASLKMCELNAIAARDEGSFYAGRKELAVFLHQHPNITELVIIPDPAPAYWNWARDFFYLDIPQKTVTFIDIQKAFKFAAQDGKDVNDLWNTCREKKSFIEALRCGIDRNILPPYDYKEGGKIIDASVTPERAAELIAYELGTTTEDDGHDIRIIGQQGLSIKKHRTPIEWYHHGGNTGGKGYLLLLLYVREQSTEYHGKYAEYVKDVSQALGIELRLKPRQTKTTPTSDGQEPSQAEPEDTRNTEYGNAIRLVQMHGDKLRYCPEIAKWYLYTGQYWQQDPGKNVLPMQYAKDVVRALHLEAATSADLGHRNSVGAWAYKSESRKVLENTIALAASESRIHVAEKSFDTHHFKINTLDGVVDLTTGEISPHNPDLFFTKVLLVRYNRKATCEKWQRFLEKIFGGDADLIAYIQRALGYTLTGDTSEDKFFFLYGNGRNGKSTFINVLASIMGDYRKNLRIETLLVQKYQHIPNDIARLPGARLVTSSEVPLGRKLNEALIKDMTGGDKLSARFMRGEEFEFLSTFKLWMFGNHKPDIEGTDEGIWNRVQLIPFLYQFPESEQRPRRVIMQEFGQERDGIFRWMLDGCLEWQKIKLSPPDAVRKATMSYRAEQDFIQEFFDSECDIDITRDVSKRDLYTRYQTWSRDLNVTPLTIRKFGNRLLETFSTVSSAHSAGNRAIWQGIGLKS